MTPKKRNKKMTMEEIIKVMMKDRRVRLSIVKRSHFYFFQYYFVGNDEENTYYPLAPFHRETFYLSEDTSVTTLVIAGFRGCGKSTQMGTSFPLWSILGEQKVKYVLILSQTESKAQMMLQLIKHQLETNELLKKDMGPFHEERGPWNMTSICLDRYNAKITAASAEQSIRSFRHMHYRPQIVVADDLENLESVKTFEQREKLYQWLIGDVIPAGAEKMRLIVLGGILHEDSLLSRLKKEITEKTRDGQYREYPFLYENGEPIWKERFKTREDIERERRKIGDEAAFQREMQLNPISNQFRIVKKEWVVEYDMMPSLESPDYLGTFIGIDPAASKRRGADSTAIVTASVFGKEDDIKVFIHPNPINEQLDFNEIEERAALLSKTMGRKDHPPTIITEDTGVQKWLGDVLEKKGIHVVRFKVGAMDKEARLRIAASLLQAGRVFFPRGQSKELQDQIINFNFTDHDDLLDAFSMTALVIMQHDFNHKGPSITIFNLNSPRRRSTGLYDSFYYDDED